MLQDGLILADNSVATNLQIQNGETLPAAGLNIGELFFLTTGTIGLYVYTGTEWLPVGSSSAVSFSGDVTGSGDTGTTIGLTLATVNSTTGSFGSATSIPVLTVNSKGLITSASSTPLSVAESQITDGTLLARVGSNETITGTWSFSSPVSGQDPTQSTHLVTKQYVDSLASGLDPKNAVRAGTTTNITLSGTQTIDGVSLVSGDRVLVKNQTVGTQNGIYVVASGAWTRASDFDGTPASEVSSGAYTFVTEGTTNGSNGYVLITNDPITIGTTAQTWSQISAAATSVPNIAGGAANQIPYQSATGVTAFSAKFKWANASNVLTIGDGLDDAFITSSNISSASSAGDVRVVGSTNTGAGRGGSVRLFGGTSSSAVGGSISLDSGSSSAGEGGSIALSSGQGGTSSGTVLVTSGTSSISSGNTGAVTISTGLLSNNTGTAGLLTVSGGDVVSSNTGTGGTVLIRGGNAGGSVTTGIGGSVDIRAGLGSLTSGTGGLIKFSTGSSSTLSERLRISNTGAIGLSGANYGTSGQVLTSNGPSSAPTWTAPTAAAAEAGTLTGTTLAANVVSSSLTSVGTLSGLAVTGTTTHTGALNLAGSSSALQLAGSAGIAGQVLISGGAGTTPVWGTASNTLVLNGTGQTSETSATGTYAGREGGATPAPQIVMNMSSAAAGNRAHRVYVNGSGDIKWDLLSDTFATQTNFMAVTRTGSTVNSITLSGSTVNLAGLAAGLKVNGSAGTSGQVLTSNGAASAPTWSAVPSPTTLAATGTYSFTTAATGVYQGVISASPYSLLVCTSATAGQQAWGSLVDGTGAWYLRAVNDTNTASSDPISITRSGTTIGTIKLAGTAVNLAIGTGGLQLDGSAGTSGQVLTSNGSAAPTWTTPTVSVLKATGTFNGDLATGVYAGNAGGTVPRLWIVNGSATANNKAWTLTTESTGTLRLGIWADDLASNNYVMEITRNGASNATLYTVTSTGVNLAIGTGGLQLNGSAGTAGQVLTSNGASAAPTWSAPTVSVLKATGTFGGDLATGVYAGNAGGTIPRLWLVNGAATANNKAWTWTAESTGTLRLGIWGDNLASNNYVMEITRNGFTSATLYTVTSTGVNLAIGTGGLQLNGSAGTSGQVLTSNGASLAPTWQAIPSPTTLAATGTYTFTTASTGVYAGVIASSPYSLLVCTAATAGQRAWSTLVDGAGTWSLRAVNDTNTASNDPITITRSGTTIGTIKLTSAGLNLAVGTSGLQLNGTAGTAGQVLTSNGAAAAPTWAVPTAVSTLPRVTAISSAVVGKRAAVTTGQTITATTWAGGGAIAVGDVFSIYNDSAAPITIGAGAGLTMYKDGNGTAVSSVTLAPRGTCSVWYNTVTEVVINGSIA